MTFKFKITVDSLRQVFHNSCAPYYLSIP